MGGGAVIARFMVAE